MIISHSWFRPQLCHGQGRMSWITLRSHPVSSSSWLTIIASDGSLVWIMHLSITLTNNCAKDAGAACWENEIVLTCSYFCINKNEEGVQLAERLKKSSMIKSDWTSRQHVQNKRTDISRSAFGKDLSDTLFNTSCKILMVPRVYKEEWQTYLSHEEEPHL